VDIISRYYPGIFTPELLVNQPGDKRPILFVEYAHSMGNSTGNMKEFWDLFRTMPRLIGGCIWDYKDQALLAETPEGKSYYAYGGDFGEILHDGNFCINGIVAADNRPKAAMYECKRLYQPVECTLMNPVNGFVRVENRHAARSLAGYNAELVILQDGSIIDSHSLGAIPLAAGRDTILEITHFLPAQTGDHEYLASIRFTLREDRPWASAGHLVASSQLALTGLPNPESLKEQPEIAGIMPGISLEENDAAWVASGSSFRVRFSKSSGSPESWESARGQLLFSPLLPNFTRALTDNDRRGWKPHRKLASWFRAEPLLLEMSARKTSPGRAEIRSVYQVIEDSARVTISYTVRGDGVVEVHYRLEAENGLPNIPRIGMQCGIRNDLRQVSWYGRGPFENYIDRRSGADAGIYSLPLERFVESYVFPQENGNRTDVRWMYLAGPEEDGLLVVADSLLSMSAWPWTQQNLQEAEHTYDLADTGFITLNIDLVQMGVGGNDSWSPVSQPLEHYQVPAGSYQYRFYIFPCKADPERIKSLPAKLKNGPVQTDSK
jgi:beta-galactosidase